MRTLTPASRRALRAKAHHLHPFVTIGQHGLTPAVLHEIDVALTAHELVKIRVFGDERDERESLYARICADLDAAPVQHLGKTLTVWRPAPPREPERAAGAPGPRPAKASRKAGPRSRGAGEAAVASPRTPTARGNAGPVAKPKARTATAKPKWRTGPAKPTAPAAATGARRRRVPH